MDEGRWTTVTESSFDHERRALTKIKEALPNTDPWYAWSNFTFTAQTGHIREIDLLIVAPNGVHMIELKDWHGRLHVENGTWVQTTPSGKKRSHGRPLHLVSQKSKELAGLLAATGVRVYVGASVCLSGGDLDFRLPPGDRVNTHTIRELMLSLNQPVRDERSRVDVARARSIKNALANIGIRRSDAEFKVGPYLLDRQTFDTGPTWADYIAQHTDLPEKVRVRIYLRERGEDAPSRASVENAARREGAVLARFRHPGAVRLRQFDPAGHPAGPALIFDYHPETLRLDEYLIRHGERIDILTRVSLVRQLAETMRSAHSGRIYHRGLAARAVHVLPGPGTGDARWLNPRLQIADWHIATHRGVDASSGMTRHAPTALSATHLSSDTDSYLAPELTAPNPDPIAMDVYGLGMLTYLMVSGAAPAASRPALMARSESGEGLRPGAIVDGLPEDLDLLVDAATAYQPTRRLSSVDEFLELLDDVEDAVTAPVAEPAVAPADTDPLSAATGEVLGGRWEVRRRLGTGSTSRALLVRDLQSEAQRNFAVLKVALSDERNELIAREADVLRRLRHDSGIIQLYGPGLVTLGGRTVLVLEYVGDERELDDTSKGRRTAATVARELRENGRLSVDQLESYGDYLFRSVDFLEGEGVWHRDIKPDNIAVRVRPNRTRQLVLIDFSLAGLAVQHVDAGTDGYLDPFLGTLARSLYDAHAERYAVAVTLHEMASGELPKWDDAVTPRQTDPVEFPYPRIQADAFDPAIRDGLVDFFQQALNRDAAQRFSDLKPMRDAWRKIFLTMSTSVPSRPSVTRHPNEPVSPVASADPESAEEQRDALAAEAALSTHLSAAGFTAAAEQFLYGLDVTTVVGLLDYSQKSLVNAPGLGARTRSEIQKRLREWNERLRKSADPLDTANRRAAADEYASAAAELDPSSIAGLSLDVLAARFVPQRNNNGSNAARVDAVIRLLAIPGDDEPHLGAWPTQATVADSLQLTQGRIAQLMKAQRQQWKKDPAVQALRAEVLDLLEGFGRVAAAGEIADALTVSRGTQLRVRERRRALALAALRVVVEVEQLAPDEAAFMHSVRREADSVVVLLALEAGEDSVPDTPSAPALLDYAVRLGKSADALSRQDTLPTASTVLDRLGAVELPAGTLRWDERRLVDISVSGSRSAAATPRLEVYPRDLPVERAIRLTQAGLVRWIDGVPRERQPGLTVEQVHERLHTRFPDFADRVLPTGEALTKALRDAGFVLVSETREDTRTLRYLPDRRVDPSSYLSGDLARRSTASVAVTPYVDDPVLATAARVEERLTDATRRDGFRVLTVQTRLTDSAVAELANRFGARPLSLTRLLLDELRELVAARPKPTWETILRADVADRGSNAANKFAEYVRTAWGRVEPRVLANLDAASSPLLLTDTAALARYDAMSVLADVAAAARRGGSGVWLLCPQADPSRDPRLGSVAVPYQAGLHEWIAIPDAWVYNAHRTTDTDETTNTAGVTA